MASHWIKCLVTLPDQPEVTGICRRLNLDRYAVVGRLIAFWAWADSVTTDGIIPHVDAAYLDDMLRKKGFAEAMAAVGWLVMTSAGIEIPKFDRHNGTSAKRRAENTDRQRQLRDVVSGCCHKTVAPSARQVDDKSATREEKRREEREEREENQNTRTAFARFWEEYPLKTDKAGASREFKKLDPDEPTLEVMLLGLAAQKVSDQGQRGIWRTPAKWLRQRGWEDHLPGAVGKGNFRDALTSALGVKS